MKPFVYKYSETLMRKWVKDEIRIQRKELESIKLVFIADSLKSGCADHKKIEKHVEGRMEVRTIRMIPLIRQHGGVPRLVPMLDHGEYVAGETYKVKSAKAVKILDDFYSAGGNVFEKFHISVATVDRFGDVDKKFRACAWFVMTQPPGYAVKEFP